MEIQLFCFLVKIETSLTAYRCIHRYLIYNSLVMEQLEITKALFLIFPKKLETGNVNPVNKNIRVDFLPFNVWLHSE